MSIQENTLKNGELDLSLATAVNYNINVVLHPSGYSNIYVQPGRNYDLVVTNQDDSFDLTIMVNDNSGSGWIMKIIPSSSHVSIPADGTSGRILVWNHTHNYDGKPKAFVSVYPEK